MTYTKTVEYKNVVIFSRKSYPMTAFFITILQIKYERFIIFY